MKKSYRLMFFLSMLVIAALACSFVTELISGAPSETATNAPVSDDNTSSNSNTNSNTNTDNTAVPPPTSTPSKPTPTASTWDLLSGTWSGCIDDDEVVEACTEAIGGFISLYLAPDCSVGEYCGNLARGAFFSEGIIYRLTLESVTGKGATMSAEAELFGDTFYGTVTLIRQGSGVIVELKGDEHNWFYRLPSGCDPIIAENVSWQCGEDLQQ